MPEPVQRPGLLRILILVIVIALSIYLVLVRDQIASLERYGYLGIFLLSILANATVIVPLPGILLVSTMGAVFNPFWVAVAAGCGASLGELSGYVAGFSGQPMAEKVKWYDAVQDWMSKFGNLTIFLLALIPNPAFDLAGISAGALKIPVVRFLFFCALGKILKMLIFSLGGGGLIDSIFSYE